MGCSILLKAQMPLQLTSTQQVGQKLDQYNDVVVAVWQLLHSFGQAREQHL